MAKYEPSAIAWPAGKRFAFTIFDDPDAQTLEQSRLVYGFLGDLGVRTTKAVWPVGPSRETNSGGETCASPAFREHCLELQAQGFEIGYHNATPHSSTREETRAALDRFREIFGHDPASMANHYNDEALYWGAERLTGLTRTLYRALQLWRDRRFRGSDPDSPYFWGDLCRERIRYCRNLVFREINTLKACPWSPYADPLRPYAREWYASAEGAWQPAFCRTISEAAQDRLEAESGACIMYTHFGLGFVENGKLHPEFERLMRRLAAKGSWFVPVTDLLDHIRSHRGEHEIQPAERAWLERRWLVQKLRYGTS